MQKGLITNEQLEMALRQQKKTGQFLGSTLVKLGFIKELDVIPVLAEQLNVEYVRL